MLLRSTLALLLFFASSFFLVPAHAAAPRSVYLSGYPTLRQQHRLTCEASTVSMATRGVLTEDQVMVPLPRNADPNLGFRGRPDGVQKEDLRDYGVYPAPLTSVLARAGYPSTSIYDGSDSVIRQYLNQGWPVVVWVTYGLLPQRPRWVLQNGRGFVLVPHEHTLLIVGYDSQTIIANDAWTGFLVRYRWQDFNRSWAYLGRMALVIGPCITPDPPRSVAPTRRGHAISWNWQASPHAARYQVTLLQLRSDGRWKAEHPVIVTGTTYTTTIPLLSAKYDLRLVALSVCGAQSSVIDSYSSVPQTTATPVSTPTVVPSASPTSTPTPSTVPTPVRYR